MYDSSVLSVPGSRSAGIEFIPPQTIRLGDRERQVGGVVYRLLHSLFGSATRALTVGELQRDVWGAQVNRNTLWSACRRARRVLIALEHPLRVAIDGDQVGLV